MKKRRLRFDAFTWCMWLALMCWMCVKWQVVVYGLKTWCETWGSSFGSYVRDRASYFMVGLLLRSRAQSYRNMFLHFLTQYCYKSEQIGCIGSACSITTHHTKRHWNWSLAWCTCFFYLKFYKLYDDMVRIQRVLVYSFISLWSLPALRIHSLVKTHTIHFEKPQNTVITQIVAMWHTRDNKFVVVLPQRSQPQTFTTQFSLEREWRPFPRARYSGQGATILQLEWVISWAVSTM